MLQKVLLNNEAHPMSGPSIREKTNGKNTSVIIEKI